MSQSDNNKAVSRSIDFTDFSVLFKSTPLSINAIAELQKKNITAFQKTQRIAFEAMQEVRTRQNEIFSQIMASTTSLANDAMKEGKPEDKLSHNAKILQQSYEQTMQSVKEISAIIQKANEETSGLIRNTTENALRDVQNSVSSIASSAAK